MHDLWIADTLDRQAAYMLGCGLSSQIESLTGTGLNQFLLPAWANLRPLLPQECRLRLPSGEHAIYNKATHDVHLQLPKVALDYKFHVLCTMSDRCSVNTSCLHFLQGNGFLVASSWGPFHGAWNSVKNAMKSSCKGRPWQACLGFLVLANLNFYPFQSSQGFRDKQVALRNYMDATDHTDERFKAVMHAFARSLGMPCESEEQQREVWMMLGK